MSFPEQNSHPSSLQQQTEAEALNLETTINSLVIEGIVVAGGSGTRFSAMADKLQARLKDVPLLAYTLTALLACQSTTKPLLDSLVLVCHPDKQQIYEQLIQQHLPQYQQRIKLVPGGKTRRDSVYQGLQLVSSCCDLVVVHDAARPFVPQLALQKAIQQTVANGCGAIIGIPVSDTLKQIDPETQAIQHTCDRSTLWQAQTPQVFLKSVLLAAHQQVSVSTPVTDDAQLVELANLGVVAMVPGTSSNLKITQPEDIHLANSILDLKH
jgi:2-C-methyl-D-erythritol 4-phosphate cytidylyltransferase